MIDIGYECRQEQFNFAIDIIGDVQRVLPPYAVEAIYSQDNCRVEGEPTSPSKSGRVFKFAGTPSQIVKLFTPEQFIALRIQAARSAPIYDSTQVTSVLCSGKECHVGFEAVFEECTLIVDGLLATLELNIK